MFTIIISILLFPLLAILSLIIFSLTFLKVGFQTALGILTGREAIDIPEVSLKILD